jgi:F-type H+-transporting ATPase subunit delta
MTTTARPYASAVFEYALAAKDLPAWEAMLESAVNITLNPSMSELLSSPTMTSSELADIYCDLLGAQLDAPKKNFIRLLAENERLSVLPDILKSFQVSRAAQEKTIAVQVTSAATLDDAYQQKLVTALTARLQRQVELHCEVDPKLLGGVIVRAGDTVIDGSIRGKLARLNEFI